MRASRGRGVVRHLGMPKSVRRVPQSVDLHGFLNDRAADPSASGAWYVYLFALADCSAFKVGFSCQPLQRIFTFSRRYFERFDLRQSLLLEVPDCEAARALEADLKVTFAAHRAEAPAWVPLPAGGHTEWFGAVYFGEAAARLRAIGKAEPACAFDVLRAQLERARASFEMWAAQQAQLVCEAWSSAQRGYAVKDRRGVLRDWLDAYRYFDLHLFSDEPRLYEFVRQSARGPGLR